MGRRVKAGAQKLVTGAFFILMGALIVLAAFGWGPVSGPPMNAPRCVVGVCGLIFASGGVVVVAPTRRLASSAVGAVVVGMTVVSAWVALFGDARYFTGSSSMFSRDTDVVVARILFAAVAVLGVAVSANAVRAALMRFRKPPS